MKPCIAAYSVGMLAVGDAFRGDFIFSQVEVQKVHKAFQEPSFHRVSVSTCKFLPCPRGILRTTTFPYFSLSRWWFCSSPSNAGILGTAFSFIGTTTPSFTIWRIIRGEHMKKAMVPANHGEEII